MNIAIRPSLPPHIPIIPSSPKVLYEHVLCKIIAKTKKEMVRSSNKSMVSQYDLLHSAAEHGHRKADLKVPTVTLTAYSISLMEKFPHKY